MSSLAQRQGDPVVPASAREDRGGVWAAWPAIGAFLAWVAAEHRRRESVRWLRRLNPRLLQDIGVEQADIEGTVDRLLEAQRLQPVPWIDYDAHRVP
jgi:uncharacterized protein YjiS (DUF1127 family)